MATDVYLEVGSKKVFASAAGWPGWCRAGKTEDAALEALADYASRYRVVCDEAGIRFPAKAGDNLVVAGKVKGSATTDFGAPGAIRPHDDDPVKAAEAKRMAALVEASWAVLAAVAKGAPAELRKGPRGGGRDRDKIVAHVADAENAYARKLGVRLPGTDDAVVRERRAAILAVLGKPSPGPAPVDKGWPLRYAAFRIAWHVLDHAWEIEDRSTP